MRGSREQRLVRERRASSPAQGGRGGRDRTPVAPSNYSSPSHGGQRFLDALRKRLVGRDYCFRIRNRLETGFHFEVERERSIARGGSVGGSDGGSVSGGHRLRGGRGAGEVS